MSRSFNRALRRPHHKTQILDELSHRFSGAKYFSKLDAKAGYWSVQLHPDSQLLTTFQTPMGYRYCFKRLPFGLKVSQDLFQAKMDQMLAECTGAEGIMDDIALHGDTEETPDDNLHGLSTV